MKNSTVLAVLGLIAIFVWLGLVGGGSNWLDASLIAWLAALRHSSPALTSAAIALTQIGSVYGTIGAVAAGSLWLWRRQQPRRAALLFGAMAIERLSADGLKLLYDRARPAVDLHPVMTHSSSYPSGHAANSLTAFVLVAMLAIPPRWRRRALAVAVPLALLVGMTRPFLGVHWPSDVIGGWAVGTIAVLLATATARRPSIAAEQQHQIIGGHRAALDDS